MRSEGTRAALLADVLERCRRHDEAAWDEFHAWFRRIAARALDRFRNLTPVEREEAEDRARVTMALGIAHGRVTADGGGAVAAYARAVIVNAARDVWRRRRPSEPLPLDLDDGEPSAMERAMLRDSLARIERAVESWSAEDRFVLVMKLDGISTATIRADLVRLFGLHVSAEAVDVRFHRLRKALRRAIREPS